MSAARLGLACIQRGTPALRRRLQHISQVSRSSRNSALSFQSRSWSFLRLNRSSESSVSITSAISINQYILIDNSLVPSLLSVLSVVSEHRDVASPARYISSFVVHHDPVVSVRRVLPLHRPPAKRAPLQIAHRYAAAVLPGFHPGSAHRSPRAAASISIFQALRKLDVQCRTGESTDFHEIISFLSFFAIRRFISLPLPFNMSTLYQTFVLHSTTNVCDDLR